MPKVLGADIELGNLILGIDAPEGTGRQASRALLAEVDGVPARRRAHGGPAGYSAYGGYGAYGGHGGQGAYGGCNGYGWSGGGSAPAPAPEPDWRLDWGRRFLPANGGSIYIDLDHLELAAPEVRSARDHVAACHAMLRIARFALHAANARQPNGRRIVALANNSDGKGHSYGSHLNVCMTRSAWQDVFERRMHPALFFLAAFQVSSIVITGAGKTGSERGPRVPWQISGRADFFEQIVGLETSYHRPLVNSRDESHCVAHAKGDARSPAPARLHSIFFDHTLCHVATWLKAGLMQIVVAMIEAGRVDRRLILRWPLQAVRRWSRDPGLRARARLVGGMSVTAVELQRMFLDGAARFVSAGGCRAAVPDADAIVAAWADTLDRLEARDFDVLARRLDWVRKRSLIERALATSHGVDWASADAAYLDQLYGSLDENEGLYWACERDGAVDRIVSDAAIDRFVHEPPHDTRAWARAMLLRSFDADEIDQVDWSFLKLRLASWAEQEEPVTVWLHAPHERTRAEHPFTRVAAAAVTHTTEDGEHAGT